MNLREVDFPPKLQCVFNEALRYIVLHGGRGGAKSWGVARALLIRARHKPLRILAAREIQKSIADSSYQLLKDQIVELGLSDFYEVLNSEIRGKNGSLFLFAGLKHNVSNIKSKEGIDIVWVEEAEKVTKNSWDTLIPTIRKDGSQIIVTFNVDVEEGETYQRFVIDPPSNAVVEKLTWRDNPWFPSVLEQERLDCLRKDPIGYDNIWEGNPKMAVEGAVYRHELNKAQEDGRIGRVLYDPSKPVNCYLDIGEADCMSIWYEQKVGLDRHLIDFTQDQFQKVPYYVEIMQRKGYSFNTIVLPHDAHQSRANAEFTVFEMFKKAFPNAKIVVNPSFPGAVKVGIEAVRNIFPFLHFDKEKCRAGLYSLKMYHYKTDPATGKSYGEEPDHEFSDAPDALRMLAMAFRVKPKKTEQSNFEKHMRAQQVSTGGWQSKLNGRRV
jgi:phage terminase large subunit